MAPVFYRLEHEVEEVSGVPVSIVSTGSGRNDTIIRERSAAAEWFGVGTR